jgi:hypothetical protein
MKILIKFPTRDRPEKFLETLNKYCEMSTNIDNLSFLVSCDIDDETMNNSSMLEILKSYKNLTVDFRANKNKIEAVNSGIEDYTLPYDIILLASDDMIPIEYGYDDIIIKVMTKYFPDTDGVLWFNDGLQEMKLNTLCILGKKYYNRFGYIYYPEYKSLYCDNEFTEVSKKLERVVYCDKVLIKHDHPGHVNLFDDLYKKNDLYANEDMLMWMDRSKKI